MPHKPQPSNIEALPPISYEAAMEEVDSILKEIENNSAPLDELLKLTERAEYLITYCQEKLRKTESETIINRT
jgi:exodeoxyribonuclease VII small subunit